MLLEVATGMGQLLHGDGAVRYCQLPQKVRRDASVTDPAARQGIAPDMQPPPNEGVGLRLDMPEVLPPFSQPGLEFRDPRELVFPRPDSEPGAVPSQVRSPRGQGPRPVAYNCGSAGMARNARAPQQPGSAGRLGQQQALVSQAWCRGV